MDLVTTLGTGTGVVGPGKYGLCVAFFPHAFGPGLTSPAFSVPN